MSKLTNRSGSFKTQKNMNIYIYSTYLYSRSYRLNNTIKYAGPLDFKRSPVKKAFIYNTGSNWSSRRESQILCYALNQEVLVLLKQKKCIARNKLGSEMPNAGRPIAFSPVNATYLLLFVEIFLWFFLGFWLTCI